MTDVAPSPAPQLQPASELLAAGIREIQASPPSAPPDAPPPSVAGAPIEVPQSVSAPTPVAPPPQVPAPDVQTLLDQLLSEPGNGPAIVESQASPNASASPAQAPAPAPVDFQTWAEKRDREFQEALDRRDQKLVEALRPRPKAAPAPERDYASELPAEYRTPENIASYKIMCQAAERAADRRVAQVEAEIRRRDERAAFQSDVQTANHQAAQVVDVVRSRGFDFQGKVGEAAATGIRKLSLALAAIDGGTPTDKTQEVLAIADALARAKVSGMVAAARQRQSGAQAASAAPPVVGAPGAPPPANATPQVPSEAEAVRQGYRNLPHWYMVNVMGQPR